MDVIHAHITSDIPGKENAADALSRLPVDRTERESEKNPTLKLARHAITPGNNVQSC